MIWLELGRVSYKMTVGQKIKQIKKIQQSKTSYSLQKASKRKLFSW